MPVQPQVGLRDRVWLCWIALGTAMLCSQQPHRFTVLATICDLSFVRVWGGVSLVWICLSLMTSGAEHLLICLLAIVRLLGDMSAQIPCLFVNRTLFFVE